MKARQYFARGALTLAAEFAFAAQLFAGAGPADMLPPQPPSYDPQACSIDGGYELVKLAGSTKFAFRMAAPEALGKPEDLTRQKLSDSRHGEIVTGDDLKKLIAYFLTEGGEYEYAALAIARDLETLEMAPSKSAAVPILDKTETKPYVVPRTGKLSDEQKKAIRAVEEASPESIVNALERAMGYRKALQSRQQVIANVEVSGEAVRDKIDRNVLDEGNVAITQEGYLDCWKLPRAQPQ